jgi:putative ABC transport system permease protein
MQQGQARESVKMAFDTLRANKLRSGLTILGIVIGVTTVIAISSIISGLNNRIADFANSMGTNTIWVFHLPFTQVQFTPEQLNRKKLTIGDVTALRELPHVMAVDGSITHTATVFQVGDVAVKYQGKKVAGTLLDGSTAQLADVMDLVFIEGRFFTDDEDRRAAHVCVLGHDTWEELFGNQSAIGKEVSIESSVYTVIGVLDYQKQPFGSGKNPNDNQVYFPMGTFHYLHPEDQDLVISVKYDDQKNKALVEDEVRELLRIRRKVKVEADDNFDMFGPDSLLKLWGDITFYMRIFMIAISSVGLMVGGVGVMNIMLVSVTERTREIGVRKALGATRRTILTQFTTEAVTLCAVGGVIGVLAGAVITWIVYLLPISLPATLSTLWVLIGFGVSCAIGLLFGIYPAWKAANLDPIEALRYE